MGAAAFLMAEYMGIPYIEVAAIAVVPALLYFAGIFFSVHLEAKKLGLKGISKDQLPTVSYLLKNCYLIIPLVVLVWLVSTGAKTMAVSAAFSIACAFVIGFINFLVTNWSNRAEGQSFASVFAETCKVAAWTASDAFAAGAKNSISVSVACGMAGLIAGSITVTGLASTLVNAIVLAAGDMVIVGLVLTMLCCIVLGMGVPTTANYCIMAATCAPILIQLGIPVLCAHFFVFYFGILADITPPVALAAYAGSAIAKSKPIATAFTASRLAIAAYIVPFIFAYFPVLLLQGNPSIPLIVFNMALSLLGLFSLAAGLCGYFAGKINPLIRIVMGVAGVCIMLPTSSFDDLGMLVFNIMGLAVVVLMFVFQKARSGKGGSGHAPSSESVA